MTHFLQRIAMSDSEVKVLLTVVLVGGGVLLYQLGQAIVERVKW